MSSSLPDERRLINVNGQWIDGLVGYRCWRSGGGLLRSVVKGSWLQQVHADRALCTPYSGVTSHVHGPVEGCKCGYFAWYSPHSSWENFAARYFYHGEIVAWGKIIKHELGFRAEHYALSALYMHDGMEGRLEVVTQLADRYDVPLVRVDPTSPGMKYFPDRG